MIDALVRAMARRCGLEDPDAFAAKGGVWAKYPIFAEQIRTRTDGGDPYRGTGRTTRTLLQALCALECGCSVEVVAANREQVKDLRERVLVYGRLAGTRTWPLFVTYPGDEHARGRNAPDVRLVDHYAAECAARRELLLVGGTSTDAPGPSFGGPPQADWLL